MSSRRLSNKQWHNAAFIINHIFFRMKLYIGNLSYQTQNEDLASFFSAHGEVSGAQVIIDRATGRSRGFGFVDMTNDTEGAAAIEACNGAMFMGRNITVNEARPQEQRPRREFRPRGDRNDYRGGGGGDRY